MVVVVVDIGVRVGERNCGKRVEGLAQEAGGLSEISYVHR